MRFEWNESKNKSNRKKHGVTFEEAITAFDDPFGLIAPDLKHTTESERRQWLIGEADHGVLVIVFTIRQPSNTYRIVSARLANRKERRIYEETKRVPI